jgi:hypothetical protein
MSFSTCIAVFFIQEYISLQASTKFPDMTDNALLFRPWAKNMNNLKYKDVLHLVPFF